MSDLFLLMNDVNFARYADDNINYNSAESNDNFIMPIQESAKKYSIGFRITKLKETVTNVIGL